MDKSSDAGPVGPLTRRLIDAGLVSLAEEEKAAGREPIDREICDAVNFDPPDALRRA